MQENGTYGMAESSFNLRQFLFRYVLRYWYLFLLFPIAGAVIAFLYLRYEVPVYRVSSSILIQAGPSASDIDEDLVLRDLGLQQGNRNLQNEIQIMRSRSLMTAVVDSLELDRAFYLEGRVQNTELYGNSPVRIDTAVVNSTAYSQVFRLQPIDDNRFLFGIEGEMKEYIFDLPFNTPYGRFIFRYNPASSFANRPLLLRFYSPESLAAGMIGRLNVFPVGNSDVLRLSYTDAVPQKAVDVVNQLIQIYNAETIREKNKVAQNTLEFVQERLAYIDLELGQVEASEETYKQQYEIPVGLEPAIERTLERIRTLEEEEEQLEVQLGLTENLESTLRLGDEPFKLLPAGLLEESRLEQTIGRINNLILERESKLQNATTSNPVVRDLEARISSLRSNLLRDVVSTRQNLEARRAEKQRQISLLEGRLDQTPRRERELRDISRQQNIKEELYLYLLQKQEEMALSMAVTTANARVLDPATASGQIRSNPLSVFGMAIGGGLMLALAFVALIEALNDKIRSEEDVKRLTSAPFIGSIAYRKMENDIVVKAGSKSSTAEMFRLLRTNLQYLSPVDKKSATFLISSATSGEGKTFISANLGMTMALAHKRTVVVGLDLRKPKLSGYFGGEDKIRGITSYLVGQATMNEIIVSSKEHEKLDYIPSGPIPPNPSELLLSDRLKELFEELRKRYDRILIDSPPFGLVTDTFLLAELSDACILVVRAGYSRKNSLKMIEEIYKDKKLTRPNVLLNGVNLKRTYSYGYSYGYGYGAKHEYYTED